MRQNGISAGVGTNVQDDCQASNAVRDESDGGDKGAGEADRGKKSRML